jgi:hypothetical protein
MVAFPRPIRTFASHCAPDVARLDSLGDEIDTLLLSILVAGADKRTVCTLCLNAFSGSADDVGASPTKVVTIRSAAPLRNERDVTRVLWRLHANTSSDRREVPKALAAEGRRCSIAPAGGLDVYTP